jgi:hypothetical protein
LGLKPWKKSSSIVLVISDKKIRSPAAHRVKVFTKQIIESTTKFFVLHRAKLIKNFVADNEVFGTTVRPLCRALAIFFNGLGN